MRTWPPKSDDQVKTVAQDRKRKILRLFHRVGRPMLIGEVAMQANLHLEVVSVLLEDMVADKLLRHPTSEELSPKTEALFKNRYILIGPVSAKIAGDD